MSGDDDLDNDNDNDDDDYIDDSELGDWRSFRKTLVDSGLTAESSEGYIDEDFPKYSSEMDDVPSVTPEKRPKSVSKANEELLKSQSEDLAKEYTEGVWAHESPFVSKKCMYCMGSGSSIYIYTCSLYFAHSLIQ